MTREAPRALDSPIVSSTEPEQLQKLHYDRIGTEYESNYSDADGQRYRERFIHKPMFEGIELAGLNVLEAMSGSGQTTAYLLSQGALVTGLDISREAIDTFRGRWPQCDAICASMVNSGLPRETREELGVPRRRFEVKLLKNPRSLQYSSHLRP